MRMAFGLVSLLVVSAILIFLMSRQAETANNANQSAQKTLAPVTGRVPSGVTNAVPGGAGGGSGAPSGDDGRIDKSAEFTTHSKGLLVTKVNPGSYFDHYYGLMQGDIITNAGEATLEGQDEAMLFQMAQQKRDLVVLRNGQSLPLKQRS